MNERSDGIDIPTHWYNIISDLPFELPPDIQQEQRKGSRSTFKLQVPLALVRQSISAEREIAIPAEVRSRYGAWRPTPLIRARRLEHSLGTKARIYYKYEGNNASGSHKLSTAIAQSYYYSQAGAKRLTTGTGAGQWGTALAIGCQAFGLECKVYMVGTSFRQKPYRKTIMQLYGAEVVPSPSPDTQVGARLLMEGKMDTGNIAFAVTEALEDALSTDGSQLSVGSGEAYSILHSTLIGLEARSQLAQLDEEADIVIGSLGAGSNFGGMAFPFLQGRLRGTSNVRCVTAEPSACPKLTRGSYCYDYTDGSGVTPLQKMYTLGHQFRTTGMHAGGLRYHACSKLVSALYHHRYIEAVACSQVGVFASAALFSRLEGIVPAPEAAHAVHVAIQEAERARDQGTSPTIVFCLSGHGLFDLAAYAEHLDGRLQDVAVTDEDIRTSLRGLPVVAETRRVDMLEEHHG
jgi:tryptophan synthase beta chain